MQEYLQHPLRAYSSSVTLYLLQKFTSVYFRCQQHHVRQRAVFKIPTNAEKLLSLYTLASSACLLRVFHVSSRQRTYQYSTYNKLYYALSRRFSETFVYNKRSSQNRTDRFADLLAFFPPSVCWPGALY